MATEEKYPNRVIQLFLGITCMATVANCQYGWTLFVGPIEDKYHWARAAIQLSFTIFLIFETWLVPLEGWGVDKFGPRPVIIFGAILVTIGWIICSIASSLGVLYFAQVLTGAGAGAVYGTCSGNSLKWFPDKRGLASGATAAGFGGGAAITVIPVASMINSSGYEQAFLVFGIVQGVIIAGCALFMPRAKLPPGTKIKPKVITSKKNYNQLQLIQQPLFWLIWALFVGVASGGIMGTASFGPVSKDYGLNKIPVTCLGVTLPLLTMAMSIDNICNGATRPIMGYLSDRFGRENLMLVVFGGEAFALLGLVFFGRSPVGFMFFAAMTFACWGEIFSLFPSMCADTFGARYAAGNAGTLYTAKGTSAFLVPIGAWLSKGGNWDRTFIMSACIAGTCSLLSFFVLKPWRRRFIENNNREVEELEKQGIFQDTTL